jgi:hypothetical protein
LCSGRLGDTAAASLAAELRPPCPCVGPVALAKVERGISERRNDLDDATPAWQ